MKKQNVLFNYLNDFVYTESLSKGKQIQSATVWNDATPGVYLEVEGDKYTLFTMTVYDEKLSLYIPGKETSRYSCK